MRIWVDADACPAIIKDILYRAAKRTHTPLVLVANQLLAIPPSPLITRIQVGQGFDVADHYIVTHLIPGDLVITADIPLAAEVIEAEGIALNPRGELYTPANIKQRLDLRNHREQIRATGVAVGGPSTLNDKNKINFANALDKLLAHYYRLHPRE